MNEQSPDAVTRRAAQQIPRRASPLTIGATGLAAMLGGSATADARKDKQKHKKKNHEDPFKLCALQAEQS